MVLLHGFTDTWRAWTRVRRAQHPIFAPTLHGHHGGPAWPAGTPLSMATSVDLLERRLDASARRCASSSAPSCSRAWPATASAR
jgi:pimeloyl-ACP methyl ester carboxylesterase